MNSADPSNSLGSRGAVGLYTKTSVESSVVKFILHARIRHRRLNDVVFVGDTFIHVKQVGHEGHLQHVAFKNDFDARIRHAATFRHEPDPEDEDFLVKLEKDASSLDAPAFPPQSIVLTLDSNDIVFIFLRYDGKGPGSFEQRAVPMPTFSRTMYQTGQHLAIDPHSRAVAVAAQEREIIVYAAKPTEQIQHEIKNHVKDWCPVLAQRPLDIDGVIQHLDFLIPPVDDADHIILLAIVVDKGKTKAIRVDWHRSPGPIQVQIHPGQALDAASTVSSLLVPLQDTAFLLVTGVRLTIWRGILSGSMTGSDFTEIEEPSQYPGNSAALPVWASWAKPRRSQAARAARDDIYLVREDGLVLLITIMKTGVSSRVPQSIAGSLDCHVGTAFASLGDEGDPDVLCVAGDSSNGRVVSIGNWPSVRRIEEMSRVDTMSIQPIELLSNWASATDSVTSDVVHTSRTRVKESDNIFITSGRQPYGAVTELRQGIEGSALAFVTLEELQTVTDVWVLPEPPLGSMLIVLSSPFETIILKQNADFDSPEAFEGRSAFDLDQRTLVAAMTFDDILVQVTPKSISASLSIHENFEDTSRLTLDDSESILFATIVPQLSTVVTAKRLGDSFAIINYSIASSDGCTITSQTLTSIPSEPLSIAAAIARTNIMVLISTADGKVAIVSSDSSGSEAKCYASPLPSIAGQSVACDHVAMLQDDNQLLAICGLRDGTLVTYMVDMHEQQPLVHLQTITLGSSTVRLGALSNNTDSAIATTGNSTMLLQWNAEHHALSVENVWITDKSQPQYTQGTVVASAQIPSAKYLSSDVVADRLLVISGEDLIVLELATYKSSVPRQMSVSGTPNRLVYAESLRHLVCSGLHYQVRKLPSKPQAPPHDKRQVWPVIDFIPSKGTHPAYTHHMQPGEKINAILPWSFRRDTEKTYSYVIVGGRYQSKDGSRKGKVWFLQPKVRSWEVVDITETRQVKFDREVTALALYDDRTYIVCAGNKVHLYRLDVEEMKWEQFCPTFTLASAGIYVTVERTASDDPQIVVTTAADSIVVLHVGITAQGEGRQLKPVCTAPRADYLISHLALSTVDDASDESTPMILTGSKYGHLIGMSTPNVDDAQAPGHRNGSALLQFEARLPRSLTRLRPSLPTARKGDRPSGLASGRILGSATDGAIVSLATLEHSSWRKFFWLQRLVEWSDVLSPFSHGSPAYVPGEDAMVGQNRAVPIGLSNNTRAAEIMLQTTNSRLNDMHIDGDVLSRVLQNGGVDEIKRLMQMLAEEDANVGSWMTEHIEEELEALETVVEMVRKIDAWLE
ncbi:Putative galactose oxidase/kelch, beta-propeller [Septoria linicola]|uniref:Galactose oxidase/kelch, beta-propeller n=1 Tax=Septoria linicola TaxID=215465 RepID=A0A9Q9AQP3_9PEZI|nr:Putative galactose oxidase/kelch, beta-propeller [Septoria linicola]